MTFLLTKSIKANYLEGDRAIAIKKRNTHEIFARLKGKTFYRGDIKNRLE
jgi:hypothetical protein